MPASFGKRRRVRTRCAARAYSLIGWLPQTRFEGSDVLYPPGICHTHSSTQRWFVVCVAACVTVCVAVSIAVCAAVCIAMYYTPS
jgi:hypothetical protein